MVNGYEVIYSFRDKFCLKLEATSTLVREAWAKSKVVVSTPGHTSE